MPAQITVTDDVVNEILGQSAPTYTFELHSPQEIAARIVANAAAGVTTVVFTHRSATAQFYATNPVRAAARAAGIPVKLWTGATPVAERVLDAETQVLVLTDALCHGFRVPGPAEVLHAELPPYTGGFIANMRQREARAAHFIS